MNRKNTKTFTLSPITLSVTTERDGDPETFKYENEHGPDGGCCCDGGDETEPKTDSATLAGIAAVCRQFADQIDLRAKEAAAAAGASTAT